MVRNLIGVELLGLGKVIRVGLVLGWVRLLGLGLQSGLIRRDGNMVVRSKTCQLRIDQLRSDQ